MRPSPPGPAGTSCGRREDKMPFEDVVALLRGEQSMLGRRSGGPAGR